MKSKVIIYTSIVLSIFLLIYIIFEQNYFQIRYENEESTKNKAKSAINVRDLEKKLDQLNKKWEKNLVQEIKAGKMNKVKNLIKYFLNYL